MALHHIPEGHRAVTPYLIVEGAAKLIDFMKEVLDGEEIMRMAMPTGGIAHAEVRIQDSIVMLADSNPEWKPMPANLNVYVPDTDATYKKAIVAGGKSLREPADMFYGVRSASVSDPCGNYWHISTQIEDISEEEMNRRAAEYMKNSTAG